MKDRIGEIRERVAEYEKAGKPQVSIEGDFEAVNLFCGAYNDIPFLLARLDALERVIPEGPYRIEVTVEGGFRFENITKSGVVEFSTCGDSFWTHQLANRAWKDGYAAALSAADGGGA